MFFCLPLSIQAPVVRRPDNVIHWINHAIHWMVIYPMDSPFEPQGPGVFCVVVYMNKARPYAVPVKTEEMPLVEHFFHVIYITHISRLSSDQANFAILAY